MMIQTTTMNNIQPLAHRKERQLVLANIPDGTISIGDAAFSLCPLLKQVTIPASVEYIGVAAFCGTNIEEVRFLGIPQEIEHSVFVGCTHLKRIIIPKGTTTHFLKFFDRSLLQETDGAAKMQIPDTPKSDILDTLMAMFSQPVVKRCHLSYNYHNFVWAEGDSVLLSELFSSPTSLIGNPSYQFRRKCLFVFMKQQTTKAIVRGKEYAIPANTTNFMRKYEEKYGTRQARIFLFTCDDGKVATFFDEVRFVRLGNNSIIVKSNL